MNGAQRLSSPSTFSDAIHERRASGSPASAVRKNRPTNRSLTPGPGAQQLEQLAAQAANLRQAGAGAVLQPVDRLRDLRREDERIAPDRVEDVADGLVAQARAALYADVGPTPYTLS